MLTRTRGSAEEHWAVRPGALGEGLGHVLVTGRGFHKPCGAACRALGAQGPRR